MKKNILKMKIVKNQVTAVSELSSDGKADVVPLNLVIFFRLYPSGVK
jgi:hypothetical protein